MSTGIVLRNSLRDILFNVKTQELWVTNYNTFVISCGEKRNN